MTVEKRHLIRKRSRERSELKIVENSKLYKEAIQAVMENRAEIIRCYKVIRELQSAITIYKAAMERRAINDSQEDQTPAEGIDTRPEEFASAQPA